MPGSSQPVPDPSPLATLVFACGKCLGRQGDADLADLLRRLVDRSQGQCRVIESGCLGHCPRHGVSVVLGRDIAAVPRPVHVISVASDLDTLVRQLTRDATASG